MDQINSALRLVEHWLAQLLALLVSIFSAIETFSYSAMTRAGVPNTVQNLVLIVIGVVFILAVLRLFGGLLRLLLMVLLILFLLHVVAPALRL